MLISPNADGSASVTIQGDLIRVDPNDMPKALRTLLEVIAQLELRVIELEKQARTRR